MDGGTPGGRLALADPRTGARLRRRGPALVGGGAAWPVLAGIPVLVPEPRRWLAARRDAVIAALVDGGLWTDDVADALAAWTAGVRATPEPEVVDFLADEEGPVDLVDGPARRLVEALLAARPALAEAVAARVGRARPLVEVGCGAGTVTRRLAGPRTVVDTSLRALLRACEDPVARPVLADAAALPFVDGAVGTLVAANLVDVLPAPEAFVAEAARVLRPGGALVVTTPDPALGGDRDDALEVLLVDAGFSLAERADGLPWVRSHGPRHHQLYVASLLVARRSG